MSEEKIIVNLSCGNDGVSNIMLYTDSGEIINICSSNPGNYDFSYLKNLIVKGDNKAILTYLRNYKKSDKELIDNFNDTIVNHDILGRSIVGLCVKNGRFYYNDVEFENYITNKIRNLYIQGIRENTSLYKKHFLFLDNLLKNPSMISINELMPFLEKGNMPITEDGCFLSYKVVDSNYMDKYTGTINNYIGSTIPKLLRNQVDDNRERTCSFGYHVCSHSYISNFYSSGNKVMICKVNPADVVSIPADYNDAKLRCTFYEVIGEDFEYSKADTLSKMNVQLERPNVRDIDYLTLDNTNSETIFTKINNILDDYVERLNELSDENLDPDELEEIDDEIEKCIYLNDLMDYNYPDENKILVKIIIAPSITSASKKEDEKSAIYSIYRYTNDGWGDDGYQGDVTYDRVKEQICNFTKIDDYKLPINMYVIIDIENSERVIGYTSCEKISSKGNIYVKLYDAIINAVEW